ncbi:MAG: zinc-ribbon domain-containing protein [Lachnospiraceae bacterium]|nr:zinc-ribbon domain-containing protein [Lachnospiraceae bacterium]
MECKDCGATLRDDQVFCPVCGSERQLVSFYNPEEDDLNLDMNIVNPHKEKEGGKNAALTKEDLQKRRRFRIIVTGIALVLCIISVSLFISYRNAHDFNYQLDKAKEELSKSNYSKASEYAYNASKLDETNIECRWILIAAYRGSSNYESVYHTLQDIMNLTAFNSEEFDKGMEIFIADEQYHEAALFLETTTDINIREKYKQYISSPPEFSEKGGDFKHEVTLSLKSASEGKIYYTVDSSDLDSGTLYKKSIVIPAGNHTVRAVFVNEFGIKSEEKMETYNVNPQAPDAPEVLSPSGKIAADTQIEIKAGDGCAIYYTWDGNEPTANSERYTGPLTAPKGNNILSAIAIDKYGQISSISKKNFIVDENVEE